MPSITCLGASREVGRSAFLLETDKKLLLDYGVKIFDDSGEPKYPLDIPQVDAAIISHAHLDHSGFVPHLYRSSKVRWFATPPTRDICEILWQDSMKIMGEKIPYDITHFKKALKSWAPMLYGQKLSVGKTDFTPLDAGHICGAAMIDIHHEGKRILYTGDFKTTKTHMHSGAKPVEDVDILILESTYAMKDHPDRRKLEEKFMDEVEETLGNGGNVLLPAFALGRSQELISMIRSFNKDVKIFLDGMGRAMTDIYVKYGKYIQDPKRFRKTASSVWMISHPRHRSIATKEPSVIVTSAGMMQGGPVLGYLVNLLPESRIILSGYSVEGTNAWKLLNEGYVTMDDNDLEVELPVQYMDFSAHIGRTQTLDFIRKANPEKIVLVHGDTPELFAEELKNDYGYDAVAPKIGDKIKW